MGPSIGAPQGAGWGGKAAHGRFEPGRVCWLAPGFGILKEGRNHPLGLPNGQHQSGRNRWWEDLRAGLVGSKAKRGAATVVGPKRHAEWEGCAAHRHSWENAARTARRILEIWG